MKSLFVILFSFTLIAVQSEFDINKRWINEKGWPIPDVKKMQFEKSEIIKNIISESICVKTFVTDENETYTLKTNKMDQNYIIKNELVETDIQRVSIYSLCNSKKILFYLVSRLEVEERDPEYGISAMGLVDIYVDLNHDKIFESRFEGSGSTPEEPDRDINQALKYLAERLRSQNCTSHNNKK